MSSHREAPEIAKDPVADGTDTYAFVSPDDPDTVTLIANFIPLQKPDGGPNFYEFGDDVRYEIHVSNRGKGESDIVYRFKFRTEVRNDGTFLYNTGPINDIDDPTWNRPQFYSVTRIKDGRSTVLGEDLRARRSTSASAAPPTTRALSQQAIHEIGRGRKVFAGQRADAFHVDLGIGVRPRRRCARSTRAHLIPLADMDGINAVQSYNVHTIALQVPIRQLTRDRTRPRRRQRPRRRDRRLGDGQPPYSRGSSTRPRAGTSPTARGSRSRGSATRCSTRCSSRWPRRTTGTRAEPAVTRRYARTSTSRSWQGLLPALYPGVFPNLAAYDKPRADLDAILLTGIPEGVVAGSRTTRVRSSPTCSGSTSRSRPRTTPHDLGLVGRRRRRLPQRSPDQRRRRDHRAAGHRRADHPAGGPVLQPDAAASAVTDGTDATPTRR